MTYKGSDKVHEATEFIKSQEGKSWAEAESMTPIQFIEATVNKTFRKNKKNRILGIGEAVSMISTTNERFAFPNWKEKEFVSENTTTDGTQEIWSEKFKELENKCNESQKDMSKYKKRFNSIKSYFKQITKVLKSSGIDLTNMPSTSKSSMISFALESDNSDSSDSDDSISDEC